MLYLQHGQEQVLNVNVQENLMGTFLEDATRLLFGIIVEGMDMVPEKRTTSTLMVETNLVIARYFAGNATKTQVVLVDK
jgi:hypothetical protein